MRIDHEPEWQCSSKLKIPSGISGVPKQPPDISSSIKQKLRKRRTVECVAECMLTKARISHGKETTSFIFHRNYRIMALGLVFGVPINI